MSIVASNKKPSARTATGWIRGFENLPELSKREQQEMLADAARNTAAMKVAADKKENSSA